MLVEGTSDKNILEFALNQLFPHLEDLFYFMDFSDTHGNKRAGGASEIKRHMETFYYSKIRTRFIAIFDNDAEGYQSRYLLLNEKIKEWPSNYRVLSYPELLCFRKYPTLAPNGSILYDDINKKACSIELYLPDDIIMNKGSYIPIEWEARRTINRIDGTKEYIYQGVISDKTAIKARFNDMKKKIEKGEQAFIPKEWERMRILLEAIVFAFK